jgi:hypothetical protein
MSFLKMNKLVYFLVFCGCVLTFETANASDGEEIPDMDLSIQTDTELSASQMQPKVNSQYSSAKSIYHYVQNLLDRARKENDTVKILCLDDKLTQIHALLRGIEERRGTLESSFAANDLDGAKQQFVILQISFSKMTGLRIKADACFGKNDIVLGVSETEVSINEDITGEETTTPGQEVFSPEPTVRPSYASGYR